jgi:hypothetical protein
MLRYYGHCSKPLLHALLSTPSLPLSKLYWHRKQYVYWPEFVCVCVCIGIDASDTRLVKIDWNVLLPFVLYLSQQHTFCARKALFDHLHTRLTRSIESKNAFDFVSMFYQQALFDVEDGDGHQPNSCRSCPLRYLATCTHPTRYCNHHRTTRYRTKCHFGPLDSQLLCIHSSSGCTIATHQEKPLVYVQATGTTAAL